MKLNHRYRYYFFSLIILLSSCQKKLSQTANNGAEHAAPEFATSRVQLTGQSLPIDTSMIFKNIKASSQKNSKDATADRIAQKVHAFYVARKFRTAWLCDKTPKGEYYTLMETLKNANKYGLQPIDYALADPEFKVNLAYLSTPLSTDELAQLDIEISIQLFKFTTHLLDGKITNVGFGKKIWKRHQEYSNADVQLLAQVNSPDQFIAAIEKLQPSHEQYARLKRALEYYRSLEANAPVTPIIFVKEKIKPADRHAAIPLVRRKLSFMDYIMRYNKNDSTSALVNSDSLHYDPQLAELVKLFQKQHGLEADGVIGEKTLKFLNQSFKDKADLIALNMDRLRWMPEKYDENSIVVNIPAYELKLFQGGQESLQMRVIVGSPDTPTPVFNNSLDYIVFSPTWTVPPSILKGEIIPRLMSDPVYYTEKNYTFYKNDAEIDPSLESWATETTNIYQYKVVQHPGPDNSLGLVKFIMPNDLNIYLHDTPNKRPFNKSFRALSHGCVRLESPEKLAESLLKEQGWDAKKIYEAMNAKNPSTVLLKKYYHVYTEYQTVWVDENGLVNFREDIYGHDRHQLRQLFPVEKKGTSLVKL